MLSSWYLLFCGLLLIPIYSWKLQFHPNVCSILDILQNPEGHGQFVQYNDDKNQHRWRERARIVRRWAHCRRQSCIYILWSNTSSDALLIQGYNLRLCMYSFYQIHPTSINKTDGGPSSKDGVTNKVSVTTRSISVHHRSHSSLGVKLLRKLHPKVLPKAIISLFLVFLSKLGILAILSAISCHWLYLVRHQPTMQASEGDIPYASNQNIFGASKGANIAINKGNSTPIFGVSEGANDLSSCSLHGFTTSFADVNSEQLNTQTHFDTDSVFFVCDNSTTRHICNEI